MSPPRTQTFSYWEFVAGSPHGREVGSSLSIPKSNRRQEWWVAKILRKGFQGDLRPRNTPPLNLARKLGIENLIESPDVMDVKILLTTLGKASSVLHFLNFFVLADVPLPYISKHSRSDDIVFSVQWNGKFMGIHGTGPSKIEPFLFL